MKNLYNFDSAKEQIIQFIRSHFSRVQIYIVRNIYSRFSIYIVDVTEEIFAEIENKIQNNVKINAWIDSIESISRVEDRFIIEDLKKSSEKLEKEIYFAERHLERTNWFIKKRIEQLKTPVILFYSFKGGLGRTTAMVLSAIQLARIGKKVALIDFDLEAPGLASLFALKNENSEELLSVNGFVDFLITLSANKRNFENLSLDDYYFTINNQALVGTAGGELIIVPSIATDPESSKSYLDKLSKISLKIGLNGNFYPDDFLCLVEQELQPDYILIDTRTGINDIGGLAFNRYAQMIFLVFYGNQQNMFGLRSIVPALKELKKNDVQFYLINSPVPENSTDAQFEKDFYLEHSYGIFAEQFYEEPYPDPEDESCEHYPIHIPFSKTAVILDDYSKLGQLLAGGKDNPYQKIADIISSSEKEKNDSGLLTEDKNNSRILKALSQENIGASEDEFKTLEDLKERFYPRKDFKYIFDRNKFLILGEKGIGKTALFSVLSHQNYALALADYCGTTISEIDNTKWIIGLDKTKEYPGKIDFGNLSEFTNAQLINYWIVLLIKHFPENYLDLKNQVVQEVRKASNKQLIQIAGDNDKIGFLENELYAADARLRKDKQTVIFLYDYLDRILPTEGYLRGRLVSALLAFYYEYFSRLQNVRAKIFLRKDIFEREANDIPDKVKLKNYSIDIQWDYDQLFNIIWKRMYEQDPDLGRQLFEKYHKSCTTKPILGFIPSLTREEHEQILSKILGERMGGNNKAYPYNWITNHIKDTNDRIHPRSMIWLFSKSAKRQLKDVRPVPHVIRSRNMEMALNEDVSGLKVTELKEEYPELQKVFNELYTKVNRSPINDHELEQALDSLQLDSPSVEIIEKLINIGVMKRYKPATKSSKAEIRYHFPDLYLFGLNLTRKGTR
ncbi:AAA family ATPase [candidate division KSB1 bacterium]|nr:AAA family ATPase [candidate division KSB1 bacterium]